MLRVSPIRLRIVIHHISWCFYIGLEAESVYYVYPHVLSRHAYNPFPEVKRTKVEASATPLLSTPSTANAIELERRQKHRLCPTASLAHTYRWSSNSARHPGTEPSSHTH